MNQRWCLSPGAIDAHCHLADPRITDIDEFLRPARALGINHFIMAGVDPKDWQRQQEISRHGVIPCFGLHPYRTARNSHQQCLEALSLLPPLLDQSLGIGEIGLDYRKTFLGTEAQQLEFFRAQLDLAVQAEKAPVFHIVQAHGAAIEVLRDFRTRLKRPGMIHAFNGSAEVAKHYLELGHFLSVGGAATFLKNKKLRRALKIIPEDRLILETDAPDQKPEGWRGELNTPTSLFVIAQAVAEVRGTTSESLLQASRQNLLRLFHKELYE